jgi:hypothetical protein
MFIAVWQAVRIKIPQKGVGLFCGIICGLYLCVGTGVCLSQHNLAGVALLRSLCTIEVDSFWEVVE